MKGGIFLFLFFFMLPMSCFSQQPQVCNLSQTNFFFIGREEHLQKIDSFFKKKDKIVLALTGGPGFGKSQIAKKYAHTYYKNYDLIWWIDAQQDIPSQFEKLALALNTLLPPKEQIVPSQLSKEALVDTIKNLLRLKKIRYLLIFDNPKTYAQVEKFVPIVHTPLDKHVLLTSRNANIWYDKIEVGQFKREESLAMIKKVIPQEKKEDMIRLADTLSDYPLGLILALKFIKSHPTVTLDKYIAMHFKRPLKEKVESPGTLSDNYPTNALSALDISLKFIEEESKDSLQTLYFMSLLNSKDIPESYIELWLKETNSSLPADDAIKHVYDQSLIGVSETTDFNVNKKLERKEKVHYLSIHDLIHQLINENISLKEKKELIEKATAVMLEIFSGPSEVFTKKILKERIHLLHAQKLCENAKQIGYSSNNLLQLKICILECLVATLRDFEAAKLYLKEIENDLKNNFKVAPYYQALFAHNKGFSLSLCSPNYEETICCMNEVLSALAPFEGFNEEKLRAIANLIQFYVLRGEDEIAAGLIEKGKNIFNKVQPKAQSFFLFAWSLFLNSQNKFEKSMKVLEKTKAYPTLSTDYPMIYFIILYQTIETLIKLEKFKEARLKIKELEKLTQEFFQQRKNTLRANALLFKSTISVYKKQNVQGAIQNLHESLDIFNEFFHGDKNNRNQAKAHFILARAYEINKEYNKALSEYLFSKDIYDRVLKNKKIDDVSDLYTELAILGTKLKDDRITHKYLRAHIKTFGVDHPRTEEILKHLDQLNLAVPN